MHITIRVKHAYGRPLFMPDDEAAYLFADIAGTETLTADTLRKIEQLGVEVRQDVQPPVVIAPGQA